MGAPGGMGVMGQMPGGMPLMGGGVAGLGA